MARFRRHPGLVVILIAFLFLGLLYDWATPVFEASDELWHYPVVEHIKSGQGLPVQRPGVATRFNQEGSQPPLYYATMAALTSWIDTSDFEQVYVRNPHAKMGKPGAEDNKNMLVHDPAVEAFPYRGTVLAVHFIRWLSLLLAATGIAFTYLACRAAFPGREWLALGAAALHAFNPMFIFISASVNNDTLAVTTGAIAFFLVVRLLTDEQARGWRSLIALGLVLSAGALTKLSALTILPVAGLAVLLVAWRGRDWRLVWRAALAVGLPMLVLAGWWYVRNLQLYGEPTGMEMMVRIAGARPPLASPLDLLAEWDGFRMSFWGVFGGFNLLASPWFYLAVDVLSLVALVGLGLWLARNLAQGRDPGWPFVLAVLWAFLTFAGVVRWTTMTFASQGRLLFSAMSAIALILALGLATFGHALRRYLPGGRESALAGGGRLSGGWALLSLPLFLVPAVVAVSDIQPTYVSRLKAVEGEIPNPMRRVIDGKLTLVGYEIDRNELAIGDRLRVTLYWQSLEAFERDFSVFVHLTDGDPEEKVGQQDSFLDGGRLSTRRLTPGTLMVDEHTVEVRRALENGTTAQVLVGLYDSGTKKALPAVDGEGRRVEYAPVASVKVPVLTSLPAEATLLQGDFAGMMKLQGYRFIPPAVGRGAPVKVRLYWQALKQPDRDYTLFAQLVDANGNQVGQNDHQPVKGERPTAGWKAGEWVVDTFSITPDKQAAPGPYRLRVGWYDLTTGKRLDLLDANGARQNDHLLLEGVALE